MRRGIEATRPQRIERLARLNAPTSLVVHEVEMAVKEIMKHDIDVGITQGAAWVWAAWALAAALFKASNERDSLKKELKSALRQSKKRTAVA